MVTYCMGQKRRVKTQERQKGREERGTARCGDHVVTRGEISVGYMGFISVVGLELFICHPSSHIHSHSSQ